MKRIGISLAVTAVAVACNVSSPPGSTGGVDSGDAGPCGRGVTIVASDYTSTNIVISSLDGVTQSPSFVSSASAKPGLSLALSGDVDVPVVPPASGRVVIIDRYGTNVLTWMNLADASVIAQLAVGTGFESNPHDYVEVDATRAFVTRFGTNPTPGQQPFDQGGDLLIVDTKSFAITGRIAMPEENTALQPCPDGMTWIGSDVVVNLQRLSSDLSQAGDGRFVGVSPATNSIDWTVNVTGLQSCGRVAVSPSGKLAAIACSSQENATTNQFVPANSDVVVYDATVKPPSEMVRLGLGTKLNAGIQPSIAFAAEDTIVGLTYGGNATVGDTAFAVNVTTGNVTALLQETQPYVLGAVHCSPGCGDVCLVSDAQSNTLKRWQFSFGGSGNTVGSDGGESDAYAGGGNGDASESNGTEASDSDAGGGEGGVAIGYSGGGFTQLPDEAVDPDIGLPPRTIGGL